MSQPTRWEYRFLSAKNFLAQRNAKDISKVVNDEFNALGREGWELVHSTGIEQTYVAPDTAGFIFKRPLP